MDGRNNPQDTQNRQLTNAVPPELNRFIQDGVTPEQFAENARRLEAYSRMNTMALQVYLQRHSQQAEQRRQEELRLIQMAQQLASGSQQQLPPSLPPPAPPPRYQQSFLPQQAHASSHAPVIHNHAQSYNKVNTNNPRWSYVDFTQGSNVQRQQHHPSVNASAPFVNQNVYPSRETNLGSHSIGGAGVLTTSTHASQTAQPPKAAPAFVHQTPQYRRYSGIATANSQANMGHAGASGGSANHGVHLSYGNLSDMYPSWLKAYGDEKAASMAREHMQLWKQGRQMHSTVPMHSTVAPHTVSVSAQNQPSQYQIPNPGGVAMRPLPHPQVREWKSYPPVASTHGQQASSQPHPVAPLSHPPRLQKSTDNLALGTDDTLPARNTGDVYNDADLQSHNMTPSSNPVVTSTDLAPTPSALPSSQAGSTQSILLASEEKGTALYTMRGLAASIKRSLNAERLAGSVEPSASSDLPSQKRKRSSSIEIIDTKPSPPDGKSYEQDPNPEAEPQPLNLVTEPDDSPSTTLPSFSEVSIPEQETIHSANGLQIPSSQHDSSHSFVPFSTLTGAVSFDNIADSVPVNHNPAPSSESTGVLEDLMTPQPTSQTVIHNGTEDPFIPVSQSPFDPLSFPHRTPTPPLAATITVVHDEGEVVEKAESTSSSHPSTLLHEIEIDSQLQLIPSGNEDDVEMSVAPGEDHVQTHFNTAPSELSQARDNDALMQEGDVRRSRSSDPPIREIDQGSMVEEYPGGEISSARAPEELAWVPTKTSPMRVQSADSAETSSPGSLPKLFKKPRRKQDFYIAVPPVSEWVVQAKHREAERKARVREKAGQGNDREYTECELANRLCLRHCHWSGCQAVLNSMYALKQHVRQHQLEVEPMGPAMTVSCQWKQCRMVCQLSNLLLHLNRHIDKGMACTYDYCDERFSRIQDLAEHEKSEHADDEPPPSAVPRPPELRSPVALPQTVPSYMTTTRPASKPSITAERHARLGPWTLGMIIGHPTAGPDWGGFNTALRVRRTTRLTDKALDIVPTPMPGTGDMSSTGEFLGQSAEYDILEEPSVASSRIFGELDTVDVTEEFYEGNGRVGTPLSVTDSDCVQVEALL